MQIPVHVGQSNVQINMIISKWRISLLFVVLLLNACAATATQNAGCHGQQIMLHIVPGVNVASPDFNAGLLRDAGVPLDYMRHLFDDYHLYCVGLEGQASLLDGVLERLRKRPDIRAVEIDRINRPQRKE